MKAKYLLLILFSTCSVAGAFAQQDGEIWTLQKCIDYAFKNNIQVKLSEASLMSSELNLRQAKMNRLPNLTANTSLTNNVGRSIDPFTNAVVDQDVSSQSYGVNSNMTLFNGFGQLNAINQNKADRDKSEYDLANQKNNTALNIANLYLNILLNQEQLESARLNKATVELQLDRVEKQVNAGALPRQNLLQSRQQFANEELNVIRAENALELSKLAVKQALQLPASTEIQFESPTFENPSDQDLSLDLEAIYNKSLSMPNVKSAEAQVESSKFRLYGARSARYPTITLAGGVRTSYSSAAPDQFPDPNSPSGFKENTYVNQLDFNLARFVQVSLNIPIFNRFQTNTNIGIAKINFDNSRLNFESTKNLHRQTIEQAYYDARAALKTFNAITRQVEALQESFRNIEQRFNVGATNSIEYNQVKNDLNRAQNDLIRAKYDLIFRLKVLDFYQGIPLQF
jgi:outer membrane protein